MKWGPVLPLGARNPKAPNPPISPGAAERRKFLAGGEATRISELGPGLEDYSSCAFPSELRSSEEFLKPGKSPGVGGRFSGIRSRQCITQGLQSKVQTAPENPSEV